MEKLDNIDLRILRLLRENAKLTTKEIAEEVNLSSTPVYDRVKRLEKEGYIKKYVSLLNYEKLNRGFEVYCSVKLSKINGAFANEFIAHVNSLNEVIECYNISGEYDYLLKVQVGNMRQYQHFLLDRLGKLNIIAGIQSMFVMANIKQAFDSNPDKENPSIEYFI